MTPPTEHFDSGRPLLLRRGRVGTLVMSHDGSALEMEFTGHDGGAHAMLARRAGKLTLRRQAPELAVA